MIIRLTLISLVALAVLAPAASAADRYTILRDCVLDGKLDGRYSAGELRDARKHLPTDSDEYSDCRDQLRQAELRAASAGDGAGGGSGGGTGAGGGNGGMTGDGAVAGMSEAAAAVAASPASGIREQVLTPGDAGETAAVEEAKSAGSRGVDVGGKSVVPGATGLGAGANARDHPPSLIAVLILLGAGSLALAVPAVRKHARIPVFRRR
jgi:hypothetical protein